MNRAGTTVIFFDDLKKKAQKRIIEIELATILEVDEVKVEKITIEEGVFGYDPTKSYDISAPKPMLDEFYKRVGEA
jgi:hypothetical protein